jgi:hypothetical protein
MTQVINELPLRQIIRENPSSIHGRRYYWSNFTYGSNEQWINITKTEKLLVKALW